MKNADEISLEQLRKMLHVSKRKAAQMLQSGVIPCRIRDTATHKYAVKLSDAEEYLARRERDRLIPGAKVKQKDTAPELALRLRGSLDLEVQEFVESVLADMPDVMTVDEAAAVIGCSRSTVLKLAAGGGIYGVKVGGRYRLAKASVVEYMVAEGKARA